jgi:GAF domain
VGNALIQNGEIDMKECRNLLPALQLATYRHSGAQLPAGPAAVPAARLRAVRDDPEAMRRLQHLHARLGGGSLESLLPEILSAAMAVTGAELGDIQLADPQTGALYLVTHRGFTPEFLDYFLIAVADDSSSCGRARNKGRQAVIPDVTTDPGFTPHLPIADAAGWQSSQSTPLLDGDRVAGIVTTHFPRPHRPSRRDMGTLNLCARLAGEAVARRLGIPANGHAPVSSLLGL